MEALEAPADVTWQGYSLAERDRRWQAVRDNAARAGFDCVFVPLCVDGQTQFQWGADVVVGERGGEVLAHRPHGLVSIT